MAPDTKKHQCFSAIYKIVICHDVGCFRSLLLSQVVEAAAVGGARCLGWPSCWSLHTSWSLGLLLRAVVQLVAGLAACGADELWSPSVVPLDLLWAKEASSSLVLPSEAHVAYVLAVPT